MTQAHLVSRFSHQGCRQRQGTPEALAPLMPDFAKVQDELDTVHFSRFMVVGRREAALPFGISTVTVGSISRDWLAGPARCFYAISNVLLPLRSRR